MGPGAPVTPAEPTQRQLDYWTKRGYLRPQVVSPGSGVAREWPIREREIARLMKRLVDAGLTVALAARVARQHTQHRGLAGSPGWTLSGTSHRIAPGVDVQVLLGYEHVDPAAPGSSGGVEPLYWPITGTDT